jgi:hypothetical protein
MQDFVQNSGGGKQSKGAGDAGRFVGRGRNESSFGDVLVVDVSGILRANIGF